MEWFTQANEELGDSAVREWMVEEVSASGITTSKSFNSTCLNHEIKSSKKGHFLSQFFQVVENISVIDNVDHGLPHQLSLAVKN
ncbi:hypothetical protein HPP92_021616 [Vanilla planifolia]|uniref:Uncharacterized protein n=1 Tax=Vanilla planifolia TaxID=51239 RepID=A0A835UFP1_VANPL|nr:hypothetical protein HPP92_021616 [Vanilla planifolia]